MFAGPNGSGKSVLKSYLQAELLGIYLNPDEIEASIRRDGLPAVLILVKLLGKWQILAVEIVLTPWPVGDQGW